MRLGANYHSLETRSLKKTFIECVSQPLTPWINMTPGVYDLKGNLEEGGCMQVGEDAGNKELEERRYE